MTPPGGLDDELADEYGNVNVQVVEPGTPADPFRQNSDPNAAPPPAPAGEGAVPAQGAAGEGTAGELETHEDELLETQPPPAQAGELSPEQEEILRQRLDAAIEAERIRIREEVRNEEIPRIQSGLDRRVAALEKRTEEAEAARDEAERQIREQQIAHLTPEEQARIRDVLDEDNGADGALE